MPLGQKQPLMHTARHGPDGRCMFSHVRGQAEPHSVCTMPLVQDGGGGEEEGWAVVVATVVAATVVFTGVAAELFRK